MTRTESPGRKQTAEATHVGTFTSNTEKVNEVVAPEKGFLEEVRDFGAQGAINRFCKSNGVGLNHDAPCTPKHVERLQKKA